MLGQHCAATAAKKAVRLLLLLSNWLILRQLGKKRHLLLSCTTVTELYRQLISKQMVLFLSFGEHSKLLIIYVFHTVKIADLVARLKETLHADDSPRSYGYVFLFASNFAVHQAFVLF
jgi:hypothetical protein